MIQPYVKHHVGLKSTIGTLFQGFLTHTHIRARNFLFRIYSV